MKLLLAILVVPFSIVVPYGLMSYFFEDFFNSFENDVAQFWFLLLKIVTCFVIMFVLSWFVDKYRGKVMKPISYK